MTLTLLLVALKPYLSFQGLSKREKHRVQRDLVLGGDDIAH